MSHPSRETLLNAATALFAARGVESVTMREIAAATGLHLPSLYHFFENKTALYRACVARAFQAAGERLAQALDAATPAERHGVGDRRIEVFFKDWADLLERDRVLLAFVWREHLRSPAWLAESALHGPMQRVATLIEQAGPLPRPEALARTAELLAAPLARILAGELLAPLAGLRRPGP